MNCESIKTKAAEAIAEFTRTHNAACLLSVENSTVIATPLANVPGKHDRSLVITTRSQSLGLTSAAWNTLGNKLYKLYARETA